VTRSRQHLRKLNPPQRTPAPGQLPGGRKAALEAVTATATQELRQLNGWFVEGTIRDGNIPGSPRRKPDNSIVQLILGC
jgi:hypothetical protein